MLLLQYQFITSVCWMLLCGIFLIVRCNLYLICMILMLALLSSSCESLIIKSSVSLNANLPADMTWWQWKGAQWLRFVSLSNCVTTRILFCKKFDSPVVAIDCEHWKAVTAPWNLVHREQYCIITMIMDCWFRWHRSMSVQAKLLR